LKTTEHIK